MSVPRQPAAPGGEGRDSVGGMEVPSRDDKWIELDGEGKQEAAKKR